MAGGTASSTRIRVELRGFHAMTTTIIRVRVKPGARRSGLVQQADGEWLAQVRAPPLEGRANRELIELVAEHFHCPRSAVSIKSGAASRIKLVTIEIR